MSFKGKNGVAGTERLRFGFDRGGKRAGLEVRLSGRGVQGPTGRTAMQPALVEPLAELFQGGGRPDGAVEMPLDTGGGFQLLAGIDV